MKQEPALSTIGQAELVEQWQCHGRLMFRLAHNILRDAAQAEDACQQAFLKAWLERGHIQEAGALRAWLVRTVVHESLQVLRRRKTEGRVLWFKARQTACSAEAVGEDAERREQVMLAVARLSEPTRTVVCLRILDGLPGNQVKEILGCSAAEVSRRLHEGMEILRQELAQRHQTVGEL